MGSAGDPAAFQIKFEKMDSDNGLEEEHPDSPRSPIFNFPASDDVQMTPIESESRPLSAFVSRQPDVLMEPIHSHVPEDDVPPSPRSPTFPDEVDDENTQQSSHPKPVPEVPPPPAEKTLYEQCNKVRDNLRRMMQTETFIRLPFILKLFSKDRFPKEPSTMEVLADCLTLEGSDVSVAEAAKYREKAHALRVELCGDEVNSTAKEELKRLISTAEGDLDLITSSDVSQPLYFAHPQADRLLTGKVRIKLETTENVYLDTDEVVMEASQECDNNAMEGEILRAQERTWQKAAAKAIVALKELVERAKHIRALMCEDEMDADEIPSTDTLANLVDNAEDTMDIIVKRGRSEPTYAETSKSCLTYIEVGLKMRLDVTKDIEVDLPPNITATAGKAVPAFFPAPLRERTVRKLRNVAAKEALSTLKLIEKKVLESASARLRKDLNDLFKNWKGLNDRSQYSETFDRIKCIIQSSKLAGLYGAKVKMYGSVPCGLALPGSDLDVNIVLPTLIDLKTKKTILPESYDRACIQGVLNYVANYFEVSKMRKMFCIDSANVPVLSYEDPKTNQRVDITVSNPDGILLTKFLRMHLNADYRVWQLVMVVKYWSKMRAVSGTPLGFINSLGWSVMVIYFLQHVAFPPIARLYGVEAQVAEHVQKNVVIRQVKWESSCMSGVNKTGIAKLVLHFFEFYQKFDFSKHFISLGMQAPKSRAQAVKEGLIPKSGDPIFIEQPMIPGKNIVQYMDSARLRATIEELQRASYGAKNVGKKEFIFEKINGNADL